MDWQQVASWWADNEWARWVVGIAAVVIYLGVGIGYGVRSVEVAYPDGPDPNDNEKMAAGCFIVISATLLWPIAIIGEFAYSWFVKHMPKG